MFLDDFDRVQDLNITCPICGKPDWCCLSKTLDKAICPRTESDKEYMDRHGNSVGYLHTLIDKVEIKSLTKIQKQKVYKTSEEVEKIVEEFVRSCRYGRLKQFAEHIGVSTFSLNLLSVGYNHNANCMSFPMRACNGDYLGIRYRFFNGKKKSLRGGREGLFLLDILPVNINEIYIVEGPTDTAALLTMGFYAVGRPNCTGGYKEIGELVNKFPFHKYVIVADQDKPGKDGAMRLLGIMPAGTKVIAPKYHKDVREYYRAFYNSKNAIRAILNTDSDYWEVLA